MEYTEEGVNHPSHYAHSSGVEAIDIQEHLSSNLGNFLKYIWRAGKKDATKKELEKAHWYLTRERQLNLLKPAHYNVADPPFVAILAHKTLQSEPEDSLLAHLLDVLVSLPEPGGGSARLEGIDFKRLIDAVNAELSKLALVESVEKQP